MIRIRWTPEAKRWLASIHSFLAARNPQAAARTLANLRSRVDMLRRFPELGQVDRETSRGLVRILVVGHYRVAYLRAGPDEVHVLGIYHMAMDYRSYLELDRKG